MSSDESSALRAGVQAAYGNRLRVRVGALIVDDVRQPSAVLLVEHEGIHGDEPFWTPPGGEVDFGETLVEALEREVREEAHIEVAVGSMRYIVDFVRPPLHTVSFYFEASAREGLPTLGSDPELGDDQLIRSLRFVPFDEMERMIVYPRGLTDRLPQDISTGFEAGIQYLGTLR